MSSNARQPADGDAAPHAAGDAAPSAQLSEGALNALHDVQSTSLTSPSPADAGGAEPSQPPAGGVGEPEKAVHMSIPAAATSSLDVPQAGVRPMAMETGAPDTLSVSAPQAPVDVGLLHEAEQVPEAEPAIGGFQPGGEPPPPPACVPADGKEGDLSYLSQLVAHGESPMHDAAAAPALNLPFGKDAASEGQEKPAHPLPPQHVPRELGIPRPVSPLRPVAQPSSYEEPGADTGLVDPEAMGVSPEDLRVTAMQRAASGAPAEAASGVGTSLSRARTVGSDGPGASHTPGTGAKPSPPPAERPLARHASLMAGPAPERRPPSAASGPAPVERRPSSAASGAAPAERAAGGSHGAAHDPQYRWALGDYMLGKTIGAGSMGKVKLGVHKPDGTKVAIKIVPRNTSVNAVRAQNAQRVAQSGAPPREAEQEEALSRAAAKDQSKEVRIQREGSLQLLLWHPYICGMREMIIHPNHYYMVFEYINGGQMLDYIISHGRLRERSARNFARQVGSALAYCHANNVVHRDLKIENILISKSGNIKIIDFGLSNLYSPHSQLSTFCGSLYFAAPELLNARLYTGPEVDIWSFGIVLYVLVCGRVPFDDQNRPALHAKIKRGHVEYPAWLSPECRHLLSRMLVTNSARRATLSEIFAHPWMNKGFDRPLSTHLPQRTPLRAGELDANVIQGMTGFEFGTPEEIERQLDEILRSDAYQQACSEWGRGTHDTDAATVSSSESHGAPPATELTRSDTVSSRRSRRFSGLDFYRRKLSLRGTRESETPPGEPAAPPGPAREPLDPTRGYHPLISIYYLVKEKMDRERLYGHSFFASSDVSLDRVPTETPVPGGNPQAAAEVPPMPTSADIPHEPVRMPEESYVSHRATDLPSKYAVPAPARPPASAAPGGTPVAAPTPVFESREKSQPQGVMLGPPRTRARADELEMSLQGSLPRDEAGDEAANTVRPLPRFPTSSNAAPRRSVSMHSAGGAPAERRPSWLAARRESAAAGVPPPLTEGIAESPTGSTPSPVQNPPSAPVGAPGEAAGSGRSSSGSSGTAASPQRGGLVRRFGSMLVRTPSRTARSTTPSSAEMGAAAPISEERAETPQPEERSFEERPSSAAAVDPLSSPTDTSKPVFLKGLFSVHTTSTRPRSVIRADLMRVLQQMGIHFHEIRGGFECTYQPSVQMGGSGGPAPRARTPSAGSGAADAAPSTPKRSNSTVPESLAATGIGELGIGGPGAATETPPQNTAPPAGASESPAPGTSDMSVNFEVFVVKVPLLLGFNGLQFRRVSGNSWQYQMLAKCILQELKL